MEILQKHLETFSKLCFSPYNFTLGLCINFYIYNLVIFLINSVYIISYLTY
jgi:hypothetical protein